MELIELDATAQRALELLTNAGMSDGSIYDYTHTGFGSILRHFHTKGILYATAEMLDNFLLEQRVLLDQGDISQWKWGLVRRSCELLKQCAAMNSIDLPDLQPWDPVWNRPKQIIQHDAPTAKQFAESENIYVLVWMVNKRMEQLGLSENTVRHYTEEGFVCLTGGGKEHPSWRKRKTSARLSRCPCTSGFGQSRSSADRHCPTTSQTYSKNILTEEQGL